MKRRSQASEGDNHPERLTRLRRKNLPSSAPGSDLEDTKMDDDKLSSGPPKEQLVTPKKPPMDSKPTDDHHNKDLRSVLQEFTNSCASDTHIKYIHHLRIWCEGRCVDDDLCSSKGHARSQVITKVFESLPFILAHHIHDVVKLTKDTEWQDLLAALRSFHMFCVIRLYVPENRKLMGGLYDLETFTVCELSSKLNHLVAYKYWNKIEGDSLRRNAAQSPAETEAQVSVQVDEEMYEEHLKFCYTPIEVEEVRPNGWVLNVSEAGFFYRQTEVKSVFLQLPQSVSSMGLLGMRLPCFSLGFRNGFWRPISDDTSSCIFFAKINPPRI